MSTVMKMKLQRATAPENLGFDSNVIKRVLTQAKELKLYYHSVMIIRDGIVAFECHRYPYTADTPHCMYSISKSIISIALGFALEENLIELDSKVVDIFHEYLKGREKDEKLKMLTVRHLVSMKSGKVPSPLIDKAKTNWDEDLINAKWEAAPGEKFRYVNECTAMLARIITQITKMSVVDYLMPRLFDKLEIERPYWECDKRGIEAGAWGIRLSAESMAKIFLCVQNEGVFNGEQIIPREYIRQAVLNQFNPEKPDKEDGYGFGFWRKSENLYRGEGFFGQTAGIFEDSNTLVILTASQAHSGDLWGTFAKIVTEGMIEKNPDAKPDEELVKMSKNQYADVIEKNKLRSPFEEKFNNKEIRFKPHRFISKLAFPMSVLSLATTQSARAKGGNISKIKIQFNSDDFVFSWYEDFCENTIKCGLNGKYLYSKCNIATHDFDVGGAAYWLDNNNLKIMIRPLQSMARRDLNIEFFENGKVLMTPSTDPDMFALFGSVIGAIRQISKNKFIQDLIEFAFRKFAEMLEPIHKGSI